MLDGIAGVARLAKLIMTVPGPNPTTVPVTPPTDIMSPDAIGVGPDAKMPVRSPIGMAREVDEPVSETEAFVM